MNEELIERLRQRIHTRRGMNGGRIDSDTKDMQESIAAIEVITAERDALAAELKALREQDPVLVQHRKPIADMQGAIVGLSEWKDGSGLKWWPRRHLYAHHVPARELTDKVIGKIYIKEARHIEHAAQREIAFARAIERYLKGEGE